MCGDPQKVFRAFRGDLGNLIRLGVQVLRSCVGPGMLMQIGVLLQELGGAKYIFLTHRDDVAAHYKWASALGAERIMHRMETNEKQRTK